MAIEFFVPGTPVPQGSMTAFVVGKRAIVTDQKAKVLKPWRTAIAEVAQTRIPFEGALQGALWVRVRFDLARPKSVRRDYPSVAPDVDKLARAVLDALVGGGLIRDDSQVVDLGAQKRYSERPGALVRVGVMPALKEEQ